MIEYGAVAQLGERELCKLEVVGSIPISSTNLRSRAMLDVSCRSRQTTSKIALAVGEPEVSSRRILDNRILSDREVHFCVNRGCSPIVEIKLLRAYGGCLGARRR
jgi:hypothetical protein